MTTNDTQTNTKEVQIAMQFSVVPFLSYPGRASMAISWQAASNARRCGRGSLRKRCESPPFPMDRSSAMLTLTRGQPHPATLNDLLRCV